MMKKCDKCFYYFPTHTISQHIDECSDDRRLQCLSCNCDYPLSVFSHHVEKCSGFEDQISYIAEYSRRKYSRSTLRIFLKFLQNAYDVNITGRDVLRTMDDDNFVINHWISFENMVFSLCGECKSDVPVDDIYVLACVDNHRICYNCLYLHSHSAVLCCPHEKCNFPIHVNELKELPFPRRLVEQLVEKYEKQWPRSTLATIKCPNSDCEWSGVELNVLVRYNIKCKICERHFCSICQATSHYRGVKCGEIARYLQEWMVWCSYGRSKLKNGAVSNNRKQVRELRRLFDQVKKMEENRERNFRHCPLCNRLVPSEGDNNVCVCGDSSKAAGPYVSQLSKNQRELEKQCIEASTVAANATHYPFKCDHCKNDIIGIRFECINCECLNFCELCEAESTMKHDNKHIFRLVLHGQSAPAQSSSRCIVQ